MMLLLTTVLVTAMTASATLQSHRQGVHPQKISNRNAVSRYDSTTFIAPNVVHGSNLYSRTETAVSGGFLRPMPQSGNDYFLQPPLPSSILGRNSIHSSLYASPPVQSSLEEKEIDKYEVLGPTATINNKIDKNEEEIKSTKSQVVQAPKTDNPISNFVSSIRTASSEGFGTRAKNVGATMEAGDVVVPLCGNLELRQSLAGRGVYPGVEYLVCDITDSETDATKRDDNDVTVREEGLPQQNNKKQDRITTIRPAYPLRAHLERTDWPITVNVSDVPLWLSKTTYEAGTALGTLMLAGTYLAIASIVATVVRVAVVPSESMIPALMPGDVVLVTRSILPPKVGDVVFFDPPRELDEAIANSKIGRAAAAAAAAGDSEKINIVPTKGKQFLKRVVGVPGEQVGVWKSNPFVALQCNDGEDCTYRVDRTGSYARPDVFPDESWNRVTTTTTINTNINAENDVNTDSGVLAGDEYFVAGDNGKRSVDSRVWGPLKRKYLFGTAQWVIFPREHFGRILDGPMSLEKEDTHGADGDITSGSGPWEVRKNGGF